MAQFILPVYCGYEIKNADGTPMLSQAGKQLTCVRRGNKNFGGLCPKHRVEAHEAAEAERKASR